MKRLALILTLIAATSGGAADPAELFDDGMALLQQAQVQYAADLDDARLALRTAEAERDNLLAERAALLEAISDLQRRLADCLAPPEPPPPPDVVRLHAFSSVTSDPFKAEIEEMGRMAPIIYLVDMDPENSGTIQPERLRLSARARLAEDFQGLVCLDMEGPYTRGLAARVGSDEWNHTIEQMALAADIVKEERPGALISYWGVPLSIWCWGNEDGAKRPWLQCRPQTRQRVIDRWCAAKPLIDRIDWFTPCAYDYYPAAEAPEEDALCLDWLPFQALVCEAMAPEKPILWSVSPRYHNALHLEWDLSLVPTEELDLQQIQPGLLHGDGVVWWGADEYYYGKGKIPADEVEPGMSWWKAWREHFHELHRAQWEMFQRMIAEPAGGG